MEYPLMKLHEDSEAFAELVGVTAETIGLPQLYVEKDYWVTKALKFLSESPHVDDVVFKGGTSLSKAYRLIDRFSEDIDLAIFAVDMGDSRRKRLLKGVEAAVNEGLAYLEGDERESKGSRFRKTVYQYPRSIEGGDFGQASSELLVEINAFTKPARTSPASTEPVGEYVSTGDIPKSFDGASRLKAKGLYTNFWATTIEIKNSSKDGAYIVDKCLKPPKKYP